MIISKSDNKRSISIKTLGDKNGQLTEIIHSMFHSQLLKEKLEELAFGVKNVLLEPLLTKHCSLSINEDTKQLELVVADKSPSPNHVFKVTRDFFSFLSSYKPICDHEGKLRIDKYYIVFQVKTKTFTIRVHTTFSFNHSIEDPTRQLKTFVRILYSFRILYNIYK